MKYTTMVIAALGMVLAWAPVQAQTNDADRGERIEHRLGHWNRPHAYRTGDVQGRGVVQGRGAVHGKGVVRGQGTASGTGTVIYRGRDGHVRSRHGTGTVQGRGIAVGKGSVRGRGTAAGRGRAAGHGHAHRR